jgi:hypothetical protein
MFLSFGCLRGNSLTGDERMLADAAGDLDRPDKVCGAFRAHHVSPKLSRLPGDGHRGFVSPRRPLGDNG